MMRFDQREHCDEAARRIAQFEAGVERLRLDASRDAEAHAFEVQSLEAGAAYDGAWLIPFTDAELEAIYAVIEGAPRGASDHEAALRSVIDKICPAAVGDPRPGGAVRTRDAMIDSAAFSGEQAARADRVVARRRPLEDPPLPFG